MTINGQDYVDGGLVAPVPSSVARSLGADFVIAVDFSSRWLETPEEMISVKDMYSIIYRAFAVLEYQLAKNVLKQSADIVIKPPVFHCHWFDFENASRIIELGEEETGLYIKEIRKQAGYKKPKETLGEKFFDFIFGPLGNKAK